MRKEIKKRIKNRLNRAEGQLAGLKRMVEADRYCLDIITQSAAVRNALSAIEDLMLENHLSTHVLEQMKGGKEKRATAEVLAIFKKAKKK